MTDHINEYPELQGLKFPEFEYKHDDGDLGREYKFKDVPGTFYSVTTVMKHIVPQKMKNYMQRYSANRQRKTLKKAGDIGTALHDAMEAHFMGRLPLLQQEGKKAVKDDNGDIISEEITEFDIRPAFDNLLGLIDLHKIKPIFIEDFLLNQAMGVAGRFDLVCEFEGQLVLADLKTGFFSIQSGWQIAAYTLMFEKTYKKQTGKDINLGMVGLHVPRDGAEAKAFVYEHKRYCMQRYLCALETFKGLNFNYLKKCEWKQLNNWSLDLLD